MEGQRGDPEGSGRFDNQPGALRGEANCDRSARAALARARHEGDEPLADLYR